MDSPELRQRVTSHHIVSNTRVVSCSSSAPRSEIRPYTQRKPVIRSNSDGEEIKLAVSRASNTLIDQVTVPLQSQYQQSSAVPHLPVLPSPIIEGRYESGQRIEKAKWSDLPSDEGEEQDVADASFAESVIVVDHPDDFTKLEYKDEPYLVSPSSAIITLESIGRSLQWTQKFPQGRHLSRAKSRTTLLSADSATLITTDDFRKPEDKLSEARAGLRLLAKRREDVLQDQDYQLSSRAAKWNYFKWTLFISILLVFAYGTLGLIGSLLTWAGAYNGAEVSVTVDKDLVILMTVAASLCLSTSIFGLVGSVLNSRAILALYSFLLWPSLVSMLAVGYTSYKRNNLRLDLKLNQTWSRYLDDLARLRVQEVLHCCGYYNTIHQATFSRDCYPRTTLPGCKGPLFRFEKHMLRRLYIVTFSIVFVHLVAIGVSIICSNHVNVTFGKGLTPRAYRLDVGHVRRNAINIIKMLSASASESSNVHHFLEVDKKESTRNKDDGLKSFPTSEKR